MISYFKKLYAEVRWCKCEGRKTIIFFLHRFFQKKSRIFLKNFFSTVFQKQQKNKKNSAFTLAPSYRRVDQDDQFTLTGVTIWREIVSTIAAAEEASSRIITYLVTSTHCPVLHIRWYLQNPKYSTCPPRF